MGSYVPSTKSQREEMLAAIGCSSIDELFDHLPKDVLLGRPLDIPEGLSESRVMDRMTAIADKDKVFKTIFRGAGAYNHYIPSIVRSVASKEEFVTAYTPYQAEISQGTLQAIFEFQTMICELTGMDSANASVYDGATAAAEAVAMCKDRKRVKALISAAAHPDVIRTVMTYCEASDTELAIVPVKDGKTDKETLASMLAADSSCFYMQQPNFYGVIEDSEELGKLTHDAGAKYIMGINPIAAALIKTPGECGADIAVGEGQPLGLPLSFGGPYLGFMACKDAMTRKLPGRIVGETEDLEGKRGFVLTLQAREQHIRREKASSNICSNQALCALTSSVYMSAMGPDGMASAAQQCCAKAHYLAQKLDEAGFKPIYSAPFFHEFVTESPISSAKAIEALGKEGILGGYPFAQGSLDDRWLPDGLKNAILWCATEQNTKEDIDRAVEILKEVCSK